MKSITFLALAGAFLLSNQIHAAIHSSAPPPQQRPTPVTVESSRTMTFVSRFNHEAYKVDIYIPKGAPPPGGYPALYVLDGDTVFATFAEAVRNKSKVKEIEPVVVIGISGADGPKGGNRTYDFTYSDMSPEEKSFSVDLGDHPRFGGYDQFFRTIQEEVKPMVNRLVPLNAKRASLFGWSPRWSICCSYDVCASRVVPRVHCAESVDLGAATKPFLRSSRTSRSECLRARLT